MNDANARRGLIFILSSPSGAGKTTLSKLLLDRGNGIELSISVTTRARRLSEADNVHYHFVTQQHFMAMRDRGELLEWAEVHGNFYGTPRAPVEQALSQGRDILFDIDWQGTRQVYEKARADTVSVFILPPSVAELKARLERRAEDSRDVIARRLANAAEEIAHWREYDYVLVNLDVGESLDSLQAILGAERMARGRAGDGAALAAAACHRRQAQLDLPKTVQRLLDDFARL